MKIVTFIFLFSLQTSLMSYFSVGGVTLDLALILAVYCGVLLKGDRGIWVGFAIGLGWCSVDVFSGFAHDLVYVYLFAVGLAGLKITLFGNWKK